MDIDHGRKALPAAGALLCSAVLLYFGTGFTPVAALTWLAPLPVLLVAPRVSGKAAAGLAFLAYLLSTANSWSFQLGSHDTPMWPVGVVMNVGMSLVFMFSVLAFRLQLRRGNALLAVVTGSAVWTGALYVVSVSNPMGLMGTFVTHQSDVPLVMQTAAVTGMWGVEFLLMLVPSTIAALLSSEVRLAGRMRAAAAAATLLALAVGAGALRLADDSGGTTTHRVAAIATNQKGWAPDLATPAARDLAAAYADQISDLPDGVRTVVLPEASFGSHEAAPAVLFEPMSRVAKARGMDVVVGFAHWEGKIKYNYALVFPATGGTPMKYLKHHDKVSPPGRELVTTSTQAGVEICLDVNFPQPSRTYAAAGTRLLAIPASDENDNGWQHSRTALLRGMENGQAVVWSARTGTVMVSDGWGRVLADARTGGPAPFTTVVADIPTGPGATPYTRFGDWFAWLCLALAALGLWLPRRP
ncbi:acyltransferase [Allokutzneria sp. A3M-2-11 16]|uniref:nitrilase-related carbon-nitrogen hydrolase n=1 Tax=Allokutzneria sp. A3M-2-11 16 TaxID=2962043 RepID=UPI0020B7B8AB|nr:nitrilase-related carbon-nitrogen hydrolase [Allokutzneria sp. A3M-2-11 16]MCP3803991.1 acyltransferase [Allokutzneria sp. A3M-2-11 16]